MSKIFDALRRADAIQSGRIPKGQSDSWHKERDFRVVTVTSNKGGVGKTTIAANLAVYARAQRPDLATLLFSFDDETTLERTFAEGREAPGETLLDAFREGSLTPTLRDGRHGVQYVPSCADIAELKRRVRGADALRAVLLSTRPRGLVVIDTKSDFEVLTQASIEVGDLVIVPVKDQASLIEARRVFDLLAAKGRPPETARILLSLIDLRVKYRNGEDADVLGHLLSEIRREGYPLFETFMSRSPKIESLHTNPEGRPISILEGAPGSIVHQQMLQLTEEMLKLVAPPTA